nr:mannan synthase 1-like [Tanacetum cinerariifolium]
MVPEVHLPKPIAIYIPATITLLNSSCTLRSLHLLVLWILFENVMSFHRSKATIIGLLGANRVNEWVVTEKLGNATKQKSNIIKPPKKSRSRFAERLLFSELLMGLFLLYVACYDMIFGKDNMFVYLLLQAGAFFVIGVGEMSNVKVLKIAGNV